MTPAGPTSRSTCAAIAEQMRRSATTTAVIDGRRETTYGELDSLSGAMARGLHARGVGRGDVVGVCTGPGRDGVAVLVAILRSGAVYLPLDPSLPAERLRFLVSDADAAVIVVDETTGPGLDVAGADRDVVEVTALAAGGEHIALDRPVAASAPMYVIYTSGSSGTPKGILVPHRTMDTVVGFDALRDDYLPTASGRCAQIASPGFDVSLLEILGTLSRGATLVIADEDARRDPTLLLQLLGSRRVQRLYITPAHLDHLALAWSSDRSRDLALGEILVSGDVFAPGVTTREFLAALEPDLVENQYGPSETHHATSMLVPGWDEGLSASVPVGRPLPEVRAYVLDPTLELLPPGTVGELYIGGDGVALGYTRDPGQTAARFVPDPFHAGDRVFRTGDLAMWCPLRGTLTVVGRNDGQVKIRGQRVEPSEVEVALTRLAGVANAAVVVEVGEDGKWLDAYVVPDDVGFLSPTRLRADLARTVPAAALPRRIIPVAAIPLTRNGKVDRAALSRSAVPTGDVDSSAPAPRAELESIVALVWARVLGVAGVGTADDFFEAGGHSMAAMRLVATLKDALWCEVSVRDVLEARTVEALVDRLVVRTTADPIEPTGARDAPLSSAQERMWWHQQLYPDSVDYNVCSVRRVRGPVSRNALRAAVEGLVERHDALGSRCRVEADGSPRSIADGLVPAIEETDLRGSGTDEVSVVRDRARDPFDLDCGPLWRVQLLRVEDDVNVLALHFHHLVVDGWSMHVVWRDFTVLYESAARLADSDPAAALPTVPVSYADYALWERRTHAEPLSPETAAWIDDLRGAPAELDLHRAVVEDDVGAACEEADFTIDPAVVSLLRALATAHAATMHMVVLCVLDIVLAARVGVRDIVTGSPAAARTEPGLEDVVGFFVNTLPVRVTWTGDPTFGEVLDVVRRSSARAQVNQQVPFDRVVAEVAPQRRPDRHPVFQVLFSLSEADPFAYPAAWSVEDIEVGNGSIRFDVEVQCQLSGDSLAGVVRTRAGTRPRSADLAELLVRAAGRVAPDASIRLSALELDDPPRASSAPSSDGSVGGIDVLDTIAERARREPDAPALDEDGRITSRADLLARSDEIADLLTSRGVRPADVVGVAVGRGREMVATLLAVAGVGAVYLPLEVAAPPDRLLTMIDRAGARLVLRSGTSTARLPDAPGVETLSVDTAAPRRDRAHASSPTRRPHGTDPAYVVFTSGSTGEPKGIVASWDTLSGIVTGARRRVADGVVPDSRSCAQVSSLGFDVSLQEILVSLVLGAQVVLLPADAATDAELLADLLETRQPEKLYLAPAQLSALVRAWEGRRPGFLRHLVVGGEPLVVSPAHRAFFAELPELVLENQYGPSETHHATTLTLRGSEVVDASERPSIGTPVPLAEVRVLDDHLGAVPDGAVGEIYIGGRGPAHGYCGAPGLTASRFVADVDRPGERMYRTGDLARWTPDGEIEYLGREDRQTNIGGLRVEPAEIERALTRTGEVAQAVVTTVDDPPRAIAYVQPAAAPFDQQRLRRELARILPRPMFPAAFVPVESFPRTENGKVDTAGLPHPPATGPERSCTATEDAVAEILADELGIDRADPDADFFALGGTSLAIPRLARLIARRWGRDAPGARQIFERPTAAAIAGAIDRGSAGDPSSFAVSFRGTAEGRTLFCLPPVVGVSWCYRALDGARGWSVRGLQDPALVGASVPHSTVDDLAAYYHGLITEQQPDGPYHLLGWSFGGVVAHEVACRLAAGGREVALLVLLDAYPPRGDDGGPYFTERVDGVRPRDQVERLAGLDLDLGDEDMGRIVETYEKNLRAIRGHRPSVHHGDMVVVQATAGRRPDDPTPEEWIPFVTGELRHVRCDVTHLDVMTEHSASRIRDLLDSASMPERASAS